ncbi:MAG: transposase [Solirubrobacteraceae bacterium]
MKLSYKKLLEQETVFKKITFNTPDTVEHKFIPLIVKAYIRLKLEKLHFQKGKSISDLAAAYAKAAPAPDNREKLRTMLSDSLLIYFLYRNCKVTQSCLAQLFGFSHRSSVRRRLRMVAVIFELIRENQRGRRSSSSRAAVENQTNYKNRFINKESALAAEGKLMADLRRKRADIRRKTVRTAEEFFILYPQLADNKAVPKITFGKETAKLTEKLNAGKTGQSKITRKFPAAALAKPSPRLTPGCYKNGKQALDFIIASRWNGQIICPLCGADKAYLFQNNKRIKNPATGSARFKCAACRRQFSAISNTALAGCRLKPQQILKAVYYVSCRPRRISYTIEKYAAEIGITSKSARRFLTILTQNSFTSAMSKYDVAPLLPRESGGSATVPKKTKKKFFALRNSLPAGGADQLISFLLKTIE